MLATEMLRAALVLTSCLACLQLTQVMRHSLHPAALPSICRNERGLSLPVILPFDYYALIVAHCTKMKVLRGLVGSYSKAYPSNPSQQAIMSSLPRCYAKGRNMPPAQFSCTS